MVDLRNCKPGDKLKTKHGLILTYIRPLPEEDYFDHEVIYPNGSHGTRIHDGHVYRNPNSRLPEDHDIVEILGNKKEEPIFETDGFIRCDYCPFGGDEKRCAAFHEVPYDTCPTEDTYDEIMKSLENEE